MRWDRAASRLELQHAEVTCATATATLTQLTLELTQAGATVTSNGNLRGDIARLAHWLPTLAPDNLRGTLAGPLDLRLANGDISGGIDLTFNNVTLGDPAAPTWSEPAIRLTARGQYDAPQDGVQLQQFKLVMPALELRLPVA